MPVPAAEFRPLLQLRLDLMRDHDDDHDAGTLVLRVVHVLVGSGAREVGVSRIDVQPGLFGVPVHAALDRGRPVPGDHGAVCGARDAGDDHHDHGRPVLAVLHDHDDERHDDDSPAMRVGILRVGLAAFAGRMVADRILVPVAVPVRDAERERDGCVSAGADAMHGNHDHDHEHDDDNQHDDHQHYDHDDMLPGLTGPRRLRRHGVGAVGRVRLPGRRVSDRVWAAVVRAGQRGRSGVRGVRVGHDDDDLLPGGRGLPERPGAVRVRRRRVAGVRVCVRRPGAAWHAAADMHGEHEGRPVVRAVHDDDDKHHHHHDILPGIRPW